MAKRYTVRTTHRLATPSSSDDYVINEMIDLSIPLSARLQRNVRQGHNFKVKSVQASLTPAEAGDIGIAFTGQLLYAPTTRASAKAWRIAFNAFRKQKSMAINRIGPHVRYDDFEVAYDSSKVYGRTSTLLTGGITDNTQEAVTLYGSSTDGEDVTLSDIYNSVDEQAPPSRFPTSDAIVKEAKYQHAFPTAMAIPINADYSASFGSFGTEPDSGAQTNFPKVYHNADVLCGVMWLRGWMLPENTIAHLQDEMILTITYEVEIGTPLAKTSFTRKFKKSSRKPRFTRRKNRRKSR